MGNSSSHSEVHVHHVEKKPDPKIKQQAEEAKKKAEELKKKKEEEEKKTFGEQIKKQIDNVIKHTDKLNLEESIDKKEGEIHVGFIGPVSAGKTTLQNVMFGLSNPVSLGHCTTECMIVHKKDNCIVWDVPGNDNSYRYFKKDNMEFIKSLDKCFILFDSDIAAVKNTILLVHKINPESLVIVRTKVDQYHEGNARTIEEEIIEDGNKVRDLLKLDKPFKTYGVSSHNVKEGKETYDWEKVSSIITSS